MAAARTRGSKTQSLSLRLDPKTKFILDFMSRIKGQSITTLVERGIKDAADRVGVGDKSEGFGNQTEAYTWVDFWDPDEGIRTLQLLANSYYPTTFDEDELRSFTLTHWPFFYHESNGINPRRELIYILWPNIERYQEIWRETKAVDHWMAGETMQNDLSAARVAPPEWPVKTDTLDDEIPF